MATLLTPPVLLALGLGYLLGSIPFGLLLTRAAGLGDIRAMGSGNIGATNVLRTGYRGLAAVTLVLDILKGTAAVYLAQSGAFGSVGGFLVLPFAAGFGAFLGHTFPVWLGFAGGKGVATFIGVLLGIYWPAAAMFVLTWLAVAALTRYSSLSALLASVTTPLGVWALGWAEIAIMIIPLTVLLIYKHRANIERLLAGREPKLGVGQ